VISSAIGEFIPEKAVILYDFYERPQELSPTAPPEEPAN
jgi:hypothetical protein